MYTYVRQNPWSKFDAQGLFETFVAQAAQGFHNLTHQSLGTTLSTLGHAAGLDQAGVGASRLAHMDVHAMAASLSQVPSQIANRVANDIHAAAAGASGLSHGQFSTTQVLDATARGLMTGILTFGGPGAAAGAATKLENSARTVVTDTGKLHQPGYLPDNAPVVRGGSETGTKSSPGGNSPAGIATHTSTVPPNNPGAGLTGFSAQSAPGMTAKETANATIKHTSYGETTAAKIRAAGGDPVPTPRNDGTLRGSSHVTVTGLHPETASKLFTPTVKKNQ